MQQGLYTKMRQQNKALLFQYRQLVQHQQKWCINILQFEQYSFFKQFNQKYSCLPIFQLRVDDIIYITLLTTIILIFYFLFNQHLNHNEILITNIFHTLILLYLVFSVFWMLVIHWFKHVLLLTVSILYPLLLLGNYQNWFSFADTYHGYTIVQYMDNLTPWVIILVIYIVYPLKQYIRNMVGALYSYMYALAVSIFLFIWPAYSMAVQLIKNDWHITLQFITQNQPLLISFLIFIVISIYLFFHRTFFQPKSQTIYSMLKIDFVNTQNIERALSQRFQAQSYFQSHFILLGRTISLIILITLIIAEVLIFLPLSRSKYIIQCIFLMIYVIWFLIGGAIIYSLPFDNSIIAPIISFIALLPAWTSILYYQSLSQFQYWVVVSCFPFQAAYWIIIRIISYKKPFLRIKIFLVTYLVIYIPLLLYVMTVQNLLTNNQTAKYILIILFLGILGLSLLIGLLNILIILLKMLYAAYKTKVLIRQEIDYNYCEKEDIPYIPYSKSSELTIAWLSEVDIQHVGAFVGSTMFMCSNIATMLTINALGGVYSSYKFYSQISKDIIYAQIPILVIFYLSTHLFIFTHNFMVPIVNISILVVIAMIGIILSYLVYDVFIYKAIGFFSLVLGIILVIFQIIKKMGISFYKFMCTILVTTFWITIILPYIQAIPLIAIYIDQSIFNRFIYFTILASVCLLIVLASIISLIFNILMNKFQEERKYKYVMQQPKMLLNQEGIQNNDDVLHILYQSYQCRDRKYVYFLKRGYPIRLHTTGLSTVQLITYNHENEIEQVPKSDVDCCWKILTCFCGADEEQTQKKLQKLLDEQILSQDQYKQLIPQSRQYRQQNATLNYRRNIGDFVSSKTLMLKNSRRGVKQLGNLYVLLEYSPDRLVVIDMWHRIFDFFANKDRSQSFIIYTDFEIFSRMAALGINSAINELFLQYAQHQWGDTVALNLQTFSYAMQHIADLIYSSSNQSIITSKFTSNPQDNVINLLVDRIYPNLCYYRQFTDYINSTQFHRSAYTTNRQQIKNSVFHQSHQQYKLNKDKNKANQTDLAVRRMNQRKVKFFQPLEPSQQPKPVFKEPKIVEKKQESCKHMIYRKYKECCKEQQVQKEQVAHRPRVQPWPCLAPQLVRIISLKDNQWNQQHQNQSHSFRLISNNILVAFFKLLDLYTYLEITLRDRDVGWTNNDFSTLIFQFKVQLYVCLGVVLVSVPLGLKGISYIAQDKLGLNENRLPATIPHPMFFFTIIYKILVYSLFSVVSQTLLSTFNCTWNEPQLLLTIDTSIECFSTEHNIYIILSLITLLCYYPLSSFTFPNFQFAEKCLDLKYRSSYLVLYFQTSFVLIAGKILIGKAPFDQNMQILFMCFNITALVALFLALVSMRPCLISWFNYIDGTIILIGIIFNVLGLVLYFTKLWLVCVLVGCLLTLIAIITSVLLIRRSYSIGSVSPQKADEDQQKEIELQWNYQKSKNIGIVKYASQMH